MPCRVGITTNPAGRKSYWEGQVVGLKNWQILAKYATKAEAQVYETTYAESHGCHASPGGQDAIGPWFVYHFEYTRVSS